jgi:hypothetical protein
MRETINLTELPPQPHQPHRPRRGWGRILIGVIIIVLVIAVGIWFVNGATQWRAVFLTNNQVYFGHFWDVPFAGTITLRSVYYLQLSQPDQQLDTQDASQLKLVKLGNEIHGPTDEMVIPMGQVLFWETLRSDSAIVTTINNGQTQAGQ